MTSTPRSLHALLGNSQRLDGGSMFGNAPRALWSRWIAPDDQHRVPLACRCLLVREPQRNILFEAGIGAFFPPDMRDRFGVLPDEVRYLFKVAAIKAYCRRANVEKVDAGPKGAVITFRENKFAQPDRLVFFIRQHGQAANAKPQPGQQENGDGGRERLGQGDVTAHQRHAEGQAGVRQQAAGRGGTH